MKNEVIKRKDIDGDDELVIFVEDYSVTAYLDVGYNHSSISFGLTSEMDADVSWMDTLTGRGAFRTIALLKSAISDLIREIEKMGFEWNVSCCERRAKLYSRYLPEDKIRIVN
jgi:hypothetical protein